MLNNVKIHEDGFKQGLASNQEIVDDENPIVASASMNDRRKRRRNFPDTDDSYREEGDGSPTLLDTPTPKRSKKKHAAIIPADVADAFKTPEGKARAKTKYHTGRNGINLEVEYDRKVLIDANDDAEGHAGQNCGHGFRNSKKKNKKNKNRGQCGRNGNGNVR